MLTVSTINNFTKNVEFNPEFLYFNCPNNKTLPFQIKIPSGETIFSTKIYKIINGIETIITPDFVNYETNEGTFIVFSGEFTTAHTFSDVYQLHIYVETDISIYNFYTNFINPVPADQIIWRAEFWDNYDNLECLFSIGYKKILYGTTPLIIDKPFYKEIIIEKTNGEKFYDYQISGDVFKPNLFCEFETAKSLKSLILRENGILYYNNQIMPCFARTEAEISTDGVNYVASIKFITNTIEKTNNIAPIYIDFEYFVDNLDEYLADNLNEYLIC